MPPSLITENVVSFLRQVPPFQFLPDVDLASVARSMSVEYFPKDTIILRAGRPAAEAMYVIQKGGVKLSIHSGAGKEFILDMRSEGESFGILSLMGRDIARLDVTAVEDTLCYSVPADRIQHLISTNADFADFLLKTSVTRYIDRSLAELREQTRLMGDTERLMYSLTVGAVTLRKPLLCGEAATILEAAQMLTAGGATCLFVAGGDGRAKGIVTDRDFAGRVVAAGLDAGAPITRIMSAPVLSIDTGAMVFEALVSMLGRDIHHLLVTADGVPSGVLTHHELLLLQGKSPLNVVRNIESQTNLEELAAAQKRIADLIPLLMREGAKANHITRVLAGVNDRVTVKILQLAEAELGPAPVEYCWVVTGSEGRSEQTFRTDQDNAIIYADGADAAAEEWFGRFAEWVRDALVRCGYPLCTGGYMASNPAWRQPLRVWKDRFAEWIGGAKRRAVEDALILFDMRPAGGQPRLCHELTAHYRELAQASGVFRSVLAYVTIENRAPLGFFRSFVLDRDGEHKDELDVKLSGTGPIVNAARLFALEAGIDATNTVDRLDVLARRAGALDMPWKELSEAFEFLTLLRLENQVRRARAGLPPGNHLRPASLTNLQRGLLKEAFKIVAGAQHRIEQRYRSALWSQLGR
jgi:CBS domain-containing protein